MAEIFRLLKKETKAKRVDVIFYGEWKFKVSCFRYQWKNHSTKSRTKGKGIDTRFNCPENDSANNDYWT